MTHVTLENQLVTSDGRRYSHEDCALCCSLSEAIDAGVAVATTVASMEEWYERYGDSPVDGTGIAVNIAWLASLGLPVSGFTGGMDVVDGLLDKGYRVTLLIWSNSFGTPYSGPRCVGHFIELCWRDPAAGTYHVMQPVGGLEVSYTRQQLVDNGQEQGWFVAHDYRQAPAVTPVHGTTSGGKPMDVTQLAAAAVKDAYIVANLVRSAQGKGFNADCLRQDVIDPQGFNGWVDAIVTGKEDAHGVYNDIVRIITEKP